MPHDALPEVVARLERAVAVGPAELGRVHLGETEADALERLEAEVDEEVEGVAVDHTDGTSPPPPKPWIGEVEREHVSKLGAIGAGWHAAEKSKRDTDRGVAGDAVLYRSRRATIPP